MKIYFYIVYSDINYTISNMFTNWNKNGMEYKLITFYKSKTGTKTL